MQSIGDPLAACAVMWVGICLYLLLLTWRTRDLEREPGALRKLTDWGG